MGYNVNEDGTVTRYGSSDNNNNYHHPNAPKEKSGCWSEILGWIVIIAIAAICAAIFN